MVKIGDRTPEQGDILQLQVFLPTESEPSGHRLVMVISPLVYNRISKLLIVCPITSHQKGWPFEVLLPDEMSTYGVVLVDQLRTVDCTARQAKVVEQATPELVVEVISRLETLIS